MTIDSNKVISGTYGTLYINIDGVDTELANVSKFSGEAEAVYETVDNVNEMGECRKLVGYKITGSFTLNRLNYDIPRAIFAKWKTANSPEMRLVGECKDPSADDKARVVFSGVTLDKLTLVDFETKKISQEEYSFNAKDADYR